MIIKKLISVYLTFAMLILLCAGCKPAQSGTAKVMFPLAVLNCAPRQMRNYFGTHYYLTAEHVLYGWGRNFGYALGLPLPEQYVSDQPVKLADDVMNVQGCGFATFILKSDKSLWVIGNYPNPETGSDYCERFFKIADGIAEIKSCGSNTFCCFVLKDTGDMYVIGTTQGTKGTMKCSNPEMRLIDTGVTHLNGPFSQAQGEGKIIEIISMDIFHDYFSYYKQNTIWYLSEDKNGNFTTEKKHVNVKSSTPYAYGYIDEDNNFCLDGYYVTEDGTELKPTNGVKVMAKNVAQLFGGEGLIFGYLTLDGNLYYTGNDFVDVDTGKAVEVGTVKIAKNVKYVDQSVQDSVMYFLKEDDSLWAVGSNKYVIGDGSIPTSIYQNNRSVYSEMNLTVTDEWKEPIKILDHVAEFTSCGDSKIAITKDGKRYIWGSEFVAAIPNAGGYSPDGDTGDAFITSKRVSSLEESNQMQAELAAYRRTDVYIVPTLWQDVFGQPFPGD